MPEVMTQLDDDGKVIAGTEEKTSEESSTENKQEKDTQSDEGSTHTKKERVPFNEDPAIQEYIDRQVEKRADKLNADIASRFQPKADEPEIPAWFGGDAKTYKAYLDDQEKGRKSLLEEARKSWKEERDSEAKAIEDANSYQEERFKAIESSKDTNPEGIKLTQSQRNRVMAIIEERQLTRLDKGKLQWDYDSAFLLFRAEEALKKNPDNLQARKKLAEVSGHEGAPAQTYATAKTIRRKGWGDWKS